MQDLKKNPRLDIFNAWLVEDAKFSDKYEFPIIKRTDFKPEKTIPFNKAKRSSKYDHWIHFYIYDYFFECVWNAPTRYLSLFKRFQGVITPDYSLYRNMPLAMQIWNTYRSRALGYWMQKQGIPVIPSVSWTDERTYSFAFEGLEKGGTYAVNTNGCIRDKLDRYFFEKGLEKLVETLTPSTIVGYPHNSKSILTKYEKTGIIISSLDHWSNSIK